MRILSSYGPFSSKNSTWKCNFCNRSSNPTAPSARRNPSLNVSDTTKPKKTRPTWTPESPRRSWSADGARPGATARPRPTHPPHAQWPPPPAWRCPPLIQFYVTNSCFHSWPMHGWLDSDGRGGSTVDPLTWIQSSIHGPHSSRTPKGSCVKFTLAAEPGEVGGWSLEGWRCVLRRWGRFFRRLLAPFVDVSSENN